METKQEIIRLFLTDCTCKNCGSIRPYIWQEPKRLCKKCKRQDAKWDKFTIIFAKLKTKRRKKRMVQIKDFRILLELPAEACGIGRNMGLSDGGAGYVLGRMIELGLIEKVKAKEINFSKTKSVDGRKMVFVLTERGRKLAGVMQEVFRILDSKKHEDLGNL